MKEMEDLIERAKSVTTRGGKLTLTFAPPHDSESSSTPAATKSTSFTSSQLTAMIVQWGKDHGDLSERSIVGLLAAMDAFFGGVDLPTTWKGVEKMFRPVHQGPIRLATCGACKRSCFGDPSQAACKACSVLRSAPKEAPVQQQQQQQAAALLVPRVVPAIAVGYMADATRQLRGLFSQREFCDLCKDYHAERAARDASRGERMYDLWDAPAARRWKQQDPDFFSSWRNLAVSQPLDGVSLMRTGSFGGQATSLVVLLEILNLPPRERRLEKYLLTFIVTTEEPAAEALYPITLAAAEYLQPLYHDGYSARDGLCVCFGRDGVVSC